MAYSNKVIDHYENPRNVGSLPKDDVNVGTGLVGAPECGDVMKLQVKVNPETGIIDDAKFKTFGCGSAIASSSLATEWLKGKTVDEALAIKNTDIVEELALPPGTHEYRFVADGVWMADPANPRTVPNPFGGLNSVIEVLPPPATSTPPARRAWWRRRSRLPTRAR